MRTLLTGASGFIGRHVAGELAHRGHDVVALVRPSSTVPRELEQRQVELFPTDLRRPAEGLGEAIEGADAIIHLAAGIAGSLRMRFDATVAGTENLISAIPAGGWSGRLVHVSSLAVYAFARIPSGATIDETSPLEPELGRRDEYAWVKGWQERLVRELAASRRCEVTIVRPGAVHGPGRDLPARLGRPLGARALLVWGGAARLPLVHVDNLASLLATCAEHPGAAGQVFNAVDDDPPRQWTYLRRWRRAQPRRVVPVPVPRAALRAAGRGFALTGGRLPGPGFLAPYTAAPVLRSFRYEAGTPRSVLGWTAPLSADEALERTFAPAAERVRVPAPSAAPAEEVPHG
jgi:nucleoside-diphosphate-sugar epimerase